MGTLITLTRRELAGHFLSFRGYVILAGVQFLLGLSLLLIVDTLNNRPFDLPITEKFPSTGLFWLVLLLVTPVITMRTFAREKSTGTFETLMTTPVSDLQVVLAKFGGAFGFYLLTFTPVIGSDVGGIPDMVRPGETGWLHENDNADSLAQKIREALSQRDRWPTLQRRAREVAVAEFDIEVNARNYRRLYEELLGGS
jgi:glycosyltransferase involved in cell wall biosynthesis